MQSRALRRIARWRSGAMFVAALGVLMAYVGFGGEPRNVVCGIGGIAVILAGTLLAVIFNVGIHNGRRNVEKILDAAERSEG